ncbi:MAG: PCMD domain-containing protein [Fibrobacter sp.]|nr:PCMD domain-containing protein [Fibrobacter sp.]
MINLLRTLGILFFALIFAACSADMDTFGTSDYHVLNEIHFEEEASNPSMYASEHKIVVTTVEVPDSMETWDSLTISDIDMSHLASLHLVDSKFKVFPSDSAELDSLAREVSYVEKKLKEGSKIRIPSSHLVYMVILSESGEPAIWQIEFSIPGVVAESSSSVEEDASSSSAEEVSSSSSANLNSDVSLSLEFANALDVQISGDTILVEFPQGTDLSKVKLDTAIVFRKSSLSPAPSSVTDWSKAQQFTVTAEDGSEKTWTVIAYTTPSSATDLQMAFEDQFKVNRFGDTISIKLVYGSTVAEAVLDSFSISAGASISPSPDSVKSWGASQSFTVTAEDGTAKTWTVLLSIAAEDETVSSDKELLSISAEGEVSAATVDASKKTVVLHLASASALSSVNVILEISKTASHNLETTDLDLRSEKTFTITAEDASFETWTISADYPKSSSADILSFTTDDFTSQVSIDTAAKTLDLKVPANQAGQLETVYFSATYSDGAKKTSPTTDYLDLSEGSAEIVVAAEDGTTVTWTVSATVSASTPQITAMTLGSGKVSGVIDQSAGTIFFNMTYTQDLDLRELTVQSLALSNDASTSDLEVGSAYDFAKKKTVTVSNSTGNSKTYTIQAGYQYPNSDFNTWTDDAFGNRNDIEYWDNGNNSALSSTKTLTTSAENETVIKMESKDAKIFGIGRFAAGNMLIAYFNPKNVGTLAMTGYDDGNELIDFGRPFYGRPKYVEFDVQYEGLGDSCDLYLLLENRTATANEGKNQYRSSSDVNTLVASAWYRATTVESTEDPDVVSITDAERSGYKTIRLKLQYGKPNSASPIYNSSVFATSLKNSAGIDNHLVETDSPDDFDVTHIRVVVASSALGNVYEGSVGATLYCDAMRLIYE